VEKVLSKKLFKQFSAIAYKHTGIALGTGKEQLVATRLSKRLRALHLNTFSEYQQYLNRNPSEVEYFINTITTNLTRFFREEEHFALLANSLRSLSNQRVRIWCAAASTGQEAWTLAMTAAEAMGDGDWRILATDIDTKVLQTAQTGWYSAQDCANIPTRLREKYLTADRGGWSFNAKLRHRVHYARVNLANAPYPMKGPLDVVFCRNVMIYFNKDVQATIASECERLLRPYGQLYLGHSESLAGISTRLKRSAPAVYQMPAHAKRAA